VKRDTCQIEKIDKRFKPCERGEKITMDVMVGTEKVPICAYHWEQLISKTRVIPIPEFEIDE